MGERALIVEVDGLETVLALHARLAASTPDGVLDLVPAARTVLVRFDPRAVGAGAVRAWVSASAGEAAPARLPGPPVEVAVAYTGADLDETAHLLGMSIDELVRRHSGADWTVAFSGFAPGFGYLVSDEWTYDVPRLATPRTRVPAGSVALAGGFSGAYPRETPGGWRVIGTTDALLFDPDAAAPALLQPGVRVSFHPVHEVIAAAPVWRDRSDMRQGIRVVAPGPLTTVQDLGRPAAASLGVPRSGAADRGALAVALRLVGDPAEAAALEIALGGFAAVAEIDTWFAVTGAWGAVSLDGRAVDPYRAHAWPRGAELRVEPFDRGLRAYLAVRGGIDVAPVLGSRSTDLLSGLGPARLSAGDRLPLGDAPADPVPVLDVAPWGPPDGGVQELDVLPGPRADWFAASASATLFDATWTVSGAADRVGVRLEGPRLERAVAGELPSEGMTPGAIQVPPDGRPVVLGPDGPATGGYPVIGVLTDAAADRLAQARPGTGIRFRHAPSGS